MIFLLRSNHKFHVMIKKNLRNKAFNNVHTLTYLASTANEDVLYFHEEMKADDSTIFKEEMAK